MYLVLTEGWVVTSVDLLVIAILLALVGTVLRLYRRRGQTPKTVTPDTPVKTRRSYTDLPEKGRRMGIGCFLMVVSLLLMWVFYENFWILPVLGVIVLTLLLVVKILFPLFRGAINKIDKKLVDRAQRKS